MPDVDDNSGAYRLYLRLRRGVTLDIGSLGLQPLKRGTYVYVGSAKRGLRQRVERHSRLAETKQGRCHWHIDRLLLHPDSRLIRTEIIAGGDECLLSAQMAVEARYSVPVPGFGATDCQSGCLAHLYRRHQ